MHVYYYEDDKRDLVLDGVRPLFRRIAGSVDAASFMRHWRQGPHLRLNVRAEDETFTDVVVPAAEEIVGGFLARRPSQRRIDPDDVLPLHRRLAELEYEQGPLLPFQPDNSMVIAPFDPRIDVVGNEHVADLIADFHADTTELAFTMTEQITTRATLFATAFDLLVATAHAIPDNGLTRGFISFRSHSEGFLCGYPEGQGQRQAWDDHYRRSADAMTARVDAVVRTVDGTGGDVPYVQEWVDRLNRSRSRVAGLIADGVSPVPEPSSQGQRTLSGMSEFHRTLFANPAWAQMQDSDSFMTYRLMVNLTYLYLTRMGVTPNKRLMLCHLVANAVEERYGVSAFDQVQQPFTGI